MLKFEFNAEAKKNVLCIRGDLIEILSDLTFEINQIYEAIEKEDEDAAKLFKESLKKSMAKDVPFSNCDEIEETTNDLQKEIEDDKERLRQSLIDLIGEVFG